MPSYNLTNNEVDIIVTWMGEVSSYLDQAFNAAGVTAREALAADPELDVYEWIRANVKHPDCVQSDWDESAMFWWIWKHDQVNITPPTRPPESAAWVAVLAELDASIVRGWDRADAMKRNDKSVQLYNLDGSTGGTMPAGSHWQHQQNIFGKVAPVLGG